MSNAMTKTDVVHEELADWEKNIIADPRTRRSEPHSVYEWGGCVVCRNETRWYSHRIQDQFYWSCDFQEKSIGIVHDHCWKLYQDCANEQLFRARLLARR